MSQSKLLMVVVVNYSLGFRVQLMTLFSWIKVSKNLRTSMKLLRWPLINNTRLNWVILCIAVMTNIFSKFNSSILWLIGMVNHTIQGIILKISKWLTLLMILFALKNPRHFSMIQLHFKLQPLQIRNMEMKVFVPSICQIKT